MRQVLLTARATREIDEAATWWAERGAPTVVDDAVSAALTFVEAFPEAGALVKIRGKWSTTRRVPVNPVGYHLYYRYDREREAILVRCFWHQRRRPPRL